MAMMPCLGALTHTRRFATIQTTETAIAETAVAETAVAESLFVQVLIRAWRI